AARGSTARKRREGGFHHVMRIGGTDRLGDHVFDSQRFADSAHGTAGDYTGAGYRRPHHNRASPEAADHIVMQGSSFAQCDAHQWPFGVFGRLADGLRDLACLAGPVTDAALAVADHHESGEAETPSALNDLGNPIDADQLLDDLAFIAAAFPICAVA